MTLDAPDAPEGTADPPTEEPSGPQVPYVPRPRLGGADRAFLLSVRGAGIFVLLLLGLVGFFLTLRAWPAFQERGWSFFVTATWRMDTAPPEYGVVALLWGTLVVALIAMVIAIPVSIGSALFISEWSPPRLRGALISLVDLLAALPSLLYGLWGFVYLQPRLVPLSAWLDGHLGGLIPIFRVDGDQFVSSYFIAGVVVSMMVLPITTSVAREAFTHSPVHEKEAAYALGGSRWGMVRAVILPYGRAGVIGGCMLGFGRALGETIAVSLLLPQVSDVITHPLETGGATISGFIVRNFGQGGVTVPALLAAGLVLFLFTLATNLAAAAIVARSRSGAGVEA